MRNVLIAIVVVGLLGFGAWSLFSTAKPVKKAHTEAPADTDTEQPAAPDPAWAREQNTPPPPVTVHRWKSVAPSAPNDPANPNDPAAARQRGRNPITGLSVDNQPVKVPDKIEIIVPPEDSTDPADKTARLAADAYKNVVKAMKLDSDEEEQFRQMLYDSKQGYAQALDASKMKGDYSDDDARAAAAAKEAAGRKEAWDNQKLIGDDAMKNLLGEQQYKVYSTIVQNPLFMANGLKFQLNEPPPDPNAPPPPKQ